MQLMAQGAGSFELFGYGLLTAAFAILAIGVVWSLTRSISDSYRFLLRLLFTVLIVKIAAAAFFITVFFTLPRRPSIGPTPPATPIHDEGQASTIHEMTEIEIQPLTGGRLVVQCEFFIRSNPSI
ncbi:MAG: hypothetical protein VXX55_08455, partial [Planctomycetota bacterium]|nr:hypothetical protein [Planctomycetota bacterium]